MYSISYEITALVARYILVGLCLIVFIRSIFIAKASAPTGNFDGNLIVASLINIDSGKTLCLGYDNIIGSSKRCDIQVTGRGIAKIHVQIYKKKNKWMLCTYTRKTTLLNEIAVGGKIEINSKDIIKLGAKRYQFKIASGEDK